MRGPQAIPCPVFVEENMRKQAVAPTGREVRFGDDEIIVSKTDVKGKITYANDVFLKVAGYTEAEVLGQPHNFIRHPGMPACVFKLLWETLEGGQEIFAYVLKLRPTGPVRGLPLQPPRALPRCHAQGAGALPAVARRGTAPQ
jgi:PAS domain-containing protein